MSADKAEEFQIGVGSQVRLKGQQTAGTVLEIKNKLATVAFGQLKSTVKLTELELVVVERLLKLITKPVSREMYKTFAIANSTLNQN